MAAEQDAEAKRIGQLTKQLRLARGLSQEGLAREIKVGVGTVSRWERGQHRGYSSNVTKLARALKVTPAVLRPVPPDTETQLDRIEAKLDELIELLTPDAGDEDGDVTTTEGDSPPAPEGELRRELSSDPPTDESRTETEPGEEPDAHPGSA